MKYVSTRGQAPVLEFGDVLLAGLATDGGLYVPDEWPAQPELSFDTTYVDTAVSVMAPYVAPSLTVDELRAMATEAYATFGHPDVCPVRPLDDGLWLLELFWGPTIAFKDVALQLETTPCTRNLPQAAYQMLVSNLIRNAFQHTQRGTIHIRQKGSELQIVNRLPPGKSRASTGFGLGLKLIRKIADRFQWALTEEKSDTHNSVIIKV